MRKFSFNPLFWTIMLGVGIIQFGTSCSATRQTTKSGSTAQIRRDVVRFAKEKKGIKYKYGGESPKSGFDCSGYTQYVYRYKGIMLPRNSTLQSKEGNRVNIKYAKQGDLVFFGKNGKVNHVAIVTENNKNGLFVIHSTTSKGVRSDNVTNSSYWKKRILFAKDVIGK